MTISEVSSSEKLQQKETHRPAHWAVAVPSDWVAVALVLALEHNHQHDQDQDHLNLHLAGGGAVGSMGSWGAGVVAESSSPPGQTAAAS